MGDFNYGGTDEESAEIKKLNAEVLEDTDVFENWEKLVRAAETLEGGLNRNSSPQAIATTRDAYDRFLAKFPLLFGYWKKYADLEFSIAGTEAAEMVFERGVASITNSVDLWTDYCSFKVETCHDPDVIRELFERGVTCVGLDFLAHPFWDKYLEFEDRLEAQDRIFAILNRVIHIPMHQYARYFERFRQLAHSRPISELVPDEILAQFRSEIEAENNNFPVVPKGDLEVERDLRTKIDNFHLETFSHTQTETTKRWTYESEVKRPYFHVTELDHHQLANWRKYLDFEEAEGDYIRVVFLYERCLVTCAFYEEFWFRYARWMLAQDGKEEEVRAIYQRASTLYVPISRPGIRLQYAYFEEMSDRVDVARDIHQAILIPLPGHVETIVSWANLQRRQVDLDAAIEVLKSQVDSPTVDVYAKAALVVEWANLLWKVKGSVDEARQVFMKNQHWYVDSRHFWIKYLEFELQQPTSLETEKDHYGRIKQVFGDLREKSHMSLATIKELSHFYMGYLVQRGTKDAMKEFLLVDREINGPASVQSVRKVKISEDGKVLQNGQEGVVPDEAEIRKGEVSYPRYYQHQTELVPPGGQTVQISSPAHLAGLLKSSVVVVADFYADWCGPCKQIAPIYEHLSASLSKPNKITFVKVNTETQKEIAAGYNISALPTFMVFKNSKPTEKIQGADIKKLQRVVQELATMEFSGGAVTSGSASRSGSTASSGSWRLGQLPRGYEDVTNQVDVKGLELLNADTEFGSVRVLFEGGMPSALSKGKETGESKDKDWVESDTDEQLMLFTPFQSMLKVHTIQLTSLPPSSSEDDGEIPMRPKTLHFYVNRPHTLGFEEAEGIPATQSITLSADDWDATGTATIALRFVKFQNVTSLVVFVVDGDGDGERVRIDRIRLIGETGAKRDQGQLKKVEDD
ncbi:MAG: hypothetical protein M1818_001627 [Claussenomyces sp. TS43310]|nr:MAG: hypothetical protein M1818_001627 [Claussenomyces sp. TS43310]